MDDLVAWLRRQVADDDRHWRVAWKWRQAHPDVVLEQLARCAALVEVLDAYAAEPDPAARAAWERAVRVLATAYERRAGYHPSWRP
ncbi:hypothetical protein CLV35_3588 [Motilibacter peucedani]|uniref:Uncharacterized protein n=1 Tax=Motilibacter peucedani TaxID=598650 RepID=A0A420XK15_9ACTN|nr:DUF6221 family protein [Motilibacter peucedani]RKS68462.1 hypothetical protein CLV35_3588 [Motilibacter peucedani]